MSTLGFDGLPMWQGLHDRAVAPEILPFDLGLDAAGFVRQSTSEAIRDRIAHIYAREDYKFITPPPGASAWANALGERKLRALLAACPDMTGLDILEVGAGSLFVAQALTRRFDVNSYVAVDPAITPAKDAKIQVIPDFFPSPALSGRKFDLVVGFSCLEHVPDPVRFLRACRAVQKTGAKGIFLTFPDCTRAFREGDLSVLVHEHLSYFDDAGTGNAFAAAGLAIQSLQSQNDLYNCLAAAATTVEKPDRATDLHAAATAFKHTASVVGNALRQRAAQGSRITIHGANPNANNLLWLSGLAGNDRVHVFDNDASKWGKFLPTCPNPIASPESPDYLDADAIYVAATSFLPEIRKYLVERGVDPGRVYSLLTDAA